MNATYLAVALALVPLGAQAVSPDDLRALNSEATAEQRARDARIKSGDLNSLVPADSRPAAAAPRSTKYSRPAPAAATPAVSAPTPTPATTGQDGQQGDQYIPPPRPAGTNNPIYSDAVGVDGKKPFGVRLGTWFTANLNRNISNAEPGSAELVLSQDVLGDHKTLPAGTILFATKQINGATKRMELMVQRGITPDGKEFTAKAIVYDTQKVSGLTGIISGDSDAIAERGVNKGLLAAAGAAAKSVAGTTVVGQAGSAATQSVLQDTSRVVDAANMPTITIYVAPQPVMVRVEETF